MCGIGPFLSGWKDLSFDEYSILHANLLPPHAVMWQTCSFSPAGTDRRPESPAWYWDEQSGEGRGGHARLKQCPVAHYPKTAWHARRPPRPHLEEQMAAIQNRKQCQRGIWKQCSRWTTCLQRWFITGKDSWQSGLWVLCNMAETALHSRTSFWPQTHR